MANRLMLNRADLHAVGMKGARELVAKVTRKTLNRSAVLCPVDTGLLRASGKSNIKATASVVTGRVEYTAKYAAAVHEGRRPVTIRPKRAGGLLRFKVGGKTVFARVVHQKARKGRPFLADALQEVAAQEGLTFRRIGR
jgi:hypothetical protein